MNRHQSMNRRPRTGAPRTRIAALMVFVLLAGVLGAHVSTTVDTTASGSAGGRPTAWLPASTPGQVPNSRDAVVDAAAAKPK